MQVQMKQKRREQLTLEHTWREQREKIKKEIEDEVYQAWKEI